MADGLEGGLEGLGDGGALSGGHEAWDKLEGLGNCRCGLEHPSAGASLHLHLQASTLWAHPCL